MRIIGSMTGQRIRGASLTDANFTLVAQPRDTVISSGGQSDRTDNDVIWTDHTTATVDREYDIQLVETVQGTLDFISIENLTPSIATVSNAGQVTRVADGTAQINYHTRLLSRSAVIPITRTGGSVASVFKQFATGSLAKHITDAITSRLSGAPTTKKPLFNGDPTIFGNFTRNTSSWTSGIDFSCFSPWNGYGLNQMGGTLISPRHVLYNAHYIPVVGGIYGTRPIWFVANDGEVVQRTLTNSIGDFSLGTDLAVAVLDSDVPSKIKFAKTITQTDIVNKLAFARNVQSAIRIPVIGCDQEKKAHIRDFTYYNSGSTDVIYFNTPTDSTRVTWFEDVIAGDSSSPAFLLINGELVVLGGWHFGGAGGCANLAASAHQTMVNSWMTTLGGGYQLTNIDLSSFPTY
jgi:hypothetical protein